MKEAPDRDDEPAGHSHIGQGLGELAYGESLDVPVGLAGNDIVSAGFVDLWVSSSKLPSSSDGVGGAHRAGGLDAPEGLGG
jgi:hypothetical protein